MKEKIPSDFVGQGPNESIPSPTIPQIEEFLKNDIVRCMHMLDAIYSDPDLLHSMAIFMHGRLENAKMKKELANQPVE